jgi:hypothetical protein
MSALGEPELAEEQHEEPQQATVHHLPRPDEPSVASTDQAVELFLAVVPELEPELDARLVDAVLEPEPEPEPEPEAVPELAAAFEVEAEPVVQPEPELEVGVAWFAQHEPELEPVEVFADAETLADPGPEAVSELTAAFEIEAEPVVQPEPELEVGVEWFAQREPELEQAKPLGDAEALADGESKVLAEPVGEPLLAQVSFDDPAETDDVSRREDAPAAEPSVACFAFTPTTRGYVLLPLPEIPSAGDTIELPDVGERIVLRVGSSPLPLDGRVCAFVEEPVTPLVVSPSSVDDDVGPIARPLAPRPLPTLRL